MACGGCGKRKAALMKKIDVAIDEEAIAIQNGKEISDATKTFLDKNKSVVLMRKRDRLVQKKKELIRSKQIIPNELNEQIEKQSEILNEYFSKRNSRLTSQEEIIQRIKKAKSMEEVIPTEFTGIVKSKNLDPFKQNPILTSDVGARQKRAILRNERITRRNLMSAINLDKKSDIRNLSEKYSDALFDLYLLIKRTES